MRGFFERIRNRIRPEPVESAPDGTADTLKSGRWPAHSLISPSAFPKTLLLSKKDVSLSRKLGTQVVLESTHVGRHRVELILSASSANTVDLSLRVPTAANQYKEPYIILEAEPGNTCEDAVREIGFHLEGRIPNLDVAQADWATFFKSAAAKLQTLRS